MFLSATKELFGYHFCVIYPVRIKYKVFRKVVLKVRTTTRVISLDKIYNGVIYFIPYVNIQYTIYNIHIHQ